MNLSLRLFLESKGVRSVRALRLSSPISLRALMTAFVLSGGAAKGDFEVGALRYLYEHGIKPGIICGTSVGAINGAKLAEGSGGFEDLEKIWLDLRFNGDMYVEEDWFVVLEPKIKALFSQSGPGILNALVGALGQSILFPPLAILDSIKLGIDTKTLVDAVDKAVEGWSLYNLQPIADKLHQKLDADKVGHSGITLRLAVVCLENGLLRYVTEAAALLERDNKTPVPVQGAPIEVLAPQCQTIADKIDGLEDLLHEALPTERAKLRGEIAQQKQLLQQCQIAHPSQFVPPPATTLVDGVLASASIPGIFRPVVTNGETYVDGGIREVIPIQAAVDLGAQLIYAISTSKVGVDQVSLHLDSDPKGRLVRILQRAVEDILIDETLQKDLNPPRGWGNQVIAIVPTVNVHDGLTIERGLISIAMGYGYMRAADVISVAPQDRQQASDLSDQITQLRLAIWDGEFDANGKRRLGEAGGGGLVPLPLPDALRNVRQMKRDLKALVEKRNQIAGAALPVAIQNGPPNWWKNWEWHSWDNFYIPTPWDFFNSAAGEVPAEPAP